MVVESPHSAATRAAHIIRCQYPDVEIPDVPITEFVLGHAAERGDKPAIVDGPSGRTLTYAQLVDHVRREPGGGDRVGAGQLASLAFQRADQQVVSIERSERFFLERGFTRQGE